MKKIEEPVGEDITINEKSTFKETANFLRKKFNLSDDEIKELQLDGESFYLLEREDIENLPVKKENQEKFRNYFEKFIWKKAEKSKIIIDHEDIKVNENNFNFGEKNRKEEHKKEIGQKFDGKKSIDKNKKDEKNWCAKIFSKCFG